MKGPFKSRSALPCWNAPPFNMERVGPTGKKISRPFSLNKRFQLRQPWQGRIHLPPQLRARSLPGFCSRFPAPGPSPSSHCLSVSVPLLTLEYCEGAGKANATCFYFPLTFPPPQPGCVCASPSSQPALLLIPAGEGGRGTADPWHLGLNFSEEGGGVKRRLGERLQGEAGGAGHVGRRGERGRYSGGLLGTAALPQISSPPP